MYPGTTSTPINRAEKAKEIWIKAEVEEHIRAGLDGHQHSPLSIYNNAQGKCLRVEKLDDIENATSWDCETVKALMGSGFLYLCRRFLTSLVRTM